jgi:ATP-dependent helicase/nuclease subunit A
MNEPDGTATGHDTGTDSTFTPLRGAQQTIRDAFQTSDSGLYTINCTAGYGKSFTIERVAAETLCRNDATGMQCPEQQICVISFSKDDAASLKPGIREALDAFAAAESGVAPVDITRDDAERLKTRLQHADHIGTIDSILRSIFREIEFELGFDDSPTVDETVKLTQIRQEVLTTLRNDPAYASTFDELATRYASETDDTAPEQTVNELVQDAFKAKRERRLTNDEFRTQLLDTVTGVYPNGRPTAFSELVQTVEIFYDTDIAQKFSRAYTDDQETVLATDQTRYDVWMESIENLCELLAAYESAYDTACRDHGVVSHKDIAYWIAEFFDPSCSHDDARSGPAVDAFRTRLQERYRTHFQEIIVDEAQDVSVVQHDALSPFVTHGSRVLLAGDVDQCIYEWRNARPELFRQATDDDTYFGIEWNTVTHESGNNSHRLRPDIADAVNTTFDDVFTDPRRGQGSSQQQTFECIESQRSPVETPTVHVAAYRPTGGMDTDEWFTNEATVLANYLSSGIASDAFNTNDSTCDSVTVLLPWREKMPVLARKLRAENLSVRNSTSYLFADPLAELITAVVAWLCDPYDPQRTQTLVTDESVPLGESTIQQFADHNYHIQRVAANLAEENTDASFVNSLHELAQSRPRHVTDSATRVLEDIIDTLALATDPFEQVTDNRQCLATLDGLLAHTEQWEDTEQYSLSELYHMLSTYREDPTGGPNRPVPPPEGYDVTLRTVHNAKGDEDQVVCVSDLSKAINAFDIATDHFISRRDSIALAPPPTVRTEPVPVADENTGPVQTHKPLRWCVDTWVDQTICGPPELRRLSQNFRAERWRLLFVAMTRARDHLVISLPQKHLGNPRNRWMATLYEALDMHPDAVSTYHSTTVPAVNGDKPLDISVNNVPRGSARTDSLPCPRATQPPSKSQTDWTPRFVNGSTLYPLASDPDSYRIAAIQNRGLQLESKTGSQLPFGLETANPDTVGTIAHDVLTTAVSKDVTTSMLKSCQGPLSDTLSTGVDKAVPAEASGDRDAITTYIRETVCPQFAHSDLWTALQSDTECYVEEPVDDSLSIAGRRLETRNHVDIVSKHDTDTWYVDELKILLGDIDAQTRKRYALQVSYYAYLLERQLPSECTVTPRLTLLGETTDHQPVSAPIVSVDTWLTKLVR